MNDPNSDPTRDEATGAADERLRSRIAVRFACVRAATERLLEPLSDEDLRCQSMEEVSPPYWTLGHTSWFFAANLLDRHGRRPDGYRHLDYTFNSYYEGLGPRLERSRRGRVASPTNAQVREYRRAVDAAVQRWVVECPPDALAETAAILTIGCEHEQQHQELLVTEILHIRGSAPDGQRIAFLDAPAALATSRGDAAPMRAVAFGAGPTTLGYQGRPIAQGGFCWDNELPAHPAHVGDYALSDRLVTNREWLAFLQDGGYRNPLLWLANGWAFAQREQLSAPLYWQREGRDTFSRFTLRGQQPLDLDAPVCHVSFYEADAFARWYGLHHADWRGARLPREVEWEHAARRQGFHREDSNLLHDDLSRCVFDVEAAPRQGPALKQMAGTAWEWTLSHYEPYPGYRAFDDALAEYNGKFMDNQRVLRGGSYATPRSQARVAYRNFWAADTRFQVTGLRLCADR
ncbi:MAG: ergothioneine biosynthesis protein EgtB [Planctomycetota bacterium]|nr:ergothioneine biosynthesis protein EgtB [Planctomycetota bacterium]